MKFFCDEVCGCSSPSQGHGTEDEDFGFFTLGHFVEGIEPVQAIELVVLANFDDVGKLGDVVVGHGQRRSLDMLIQML